MYKLSLILYLFPPYLATVFGTLPALLFGHILLREGSHNLTVKIRFIYQPVDVALNESLKEDLNNKVSGELLILILYHLS